MIRRIIAILLLAAPLHAASIRKVRLINISAQAAATLISALIQHKTHNLSAVLGYGALSGYGFYESKILVRGGHTQSGWLLANAAGSISENVAAGRGPIDQLGYSLGPLRIRFSLLDRNADSYAYVDLHTYQVAALVDEYRASDRMKFRSGMIAFERDTVYPRHQGFGPFVGVTYGMFPGVWIHAQRSTWHHEVIHAVQSLQADAVDPSFRIFSYEPKRAAKKRIVRFEFVKLGLFNLASDVVTDHQQYPNRWVEIEAYRLAQDRAP